MAQAWNPKEPAIAATRATVAAHAPAAALAADDDGKDFEFGARGFVATLEDPLIRNKDGKPVYDLSAYAYLDGPAPDTVNPSLWRQARLLTKHGLFKVCEGVWQVRGFDVSTVSFVDTAEGWVVVDPLTTVDVAREALGLVRRHVADKPVAAVIYSHSHADHFGGVRGVVSLEDEARVRVIAPEGFMEHAVSENVIAGIAMNRRARFQFGHTLCCGPRGEVTSGLGPRLSRGELSLIAPTDLVTFTGQVIEVGGVRFVFQLTPGPRRRRR